MLDSDTYSYVTKVTKDSISYGGEGADIMKGGPGADTFTCDQFDTILDFNSDEGDKVNGTCSPEDRAVPKTIVADSALPSSEFDSENKIGQELEPQFLQ